MKRKHKRLTFVAISICLLGMAAGLVLTALEENIVFFYSPTDLIKSPPQPSQRLRLGGLVANSSVKKIGHGITLFNITDNANTITVRYKGIIPDLFREGQGVVAEGQFDALVFHADNVLAKHDENYMPPEVANALKKSGQWRDDKTSRGDKAE